MFWGRQVQCCVTSLDSGSLEAPSKEKIIVDPGLLGKHELRSTSRTWGSHVAEVLLDRRAPWRLKSSFQA